MLRNQLIHFNWGKRTTALEQLRILSPYRKAGYEISNGVEAGRLSLEKLGAKSIAVFQRDFPVRFSEYQRIMQHARLNKVPVVFDLDDYLIAMPSDHPNRVVNDYTAALLPLLIALQEVDLVTVSTPALKDLLQHYAPQTLVLPNYLDETLWRYRAAQENLKAEGGTLTLLFMGTSSHLPDLEMISPVLLRLLNKYGGRLKFLCYGAEPPKALKGHPFVEQKAAETFVYTEFIGQFLQTEADLAIAPLVDNSFNRCKSNLKFLEYSALGLPAVYSALEPYTDIVREGENGFLASYPEEWEAKIEALLGSAELRLKIAEGAQADLKQSYQLGSHADKWLEVSERLEAAVPAQRKPNRDLDDLKEIALQLESLQRQTETWINSLDTKISSLQRNETALEDELGRLLSSPSWKLTRPLRKIQNLFRGKA